jgi:predicted unusual protein kinase regulating ubiquinone biosynthesis (AarF/ABC1/UbiB family)
MNEASSFLRKASRIVSVSGVASSAVAQSVVSKLFGKKDITPDIIKSALGTLKGPAMKAGQLLSMIPGLLSDDLRVALEDLQANAPPMGEPFVKRRMKTELGTDWQKYFHFFDLKAHNAASLGQVHKAQLLDGTEVACKLQYPNMKNVVDGDIAQLHFLLNILQNFYPAFDLSLLSEELDDRLLEELDYCLELKNLENFQHIFSKTPVNLVIIPKVFPDQSTSRLLVMEWVDGVHLKETLSWDIEKKERIAKNLFAAFYYPLYHHGILHGDPHGGNYLVQENGSVVLLDFGCVRKFSKTFLEGSIQLYQALESNNHEQFVYAYSLWGFEDLTPDLISALNIWAGYLYAPLLDDRKRLLIEDANAGKEAVYGVFEALQRSGKVRPPKEFLLMDRAAVGVASAMMSLNVRLNWHQLFWETVRGSRLLNS